MKIAFVFCGQGSQYLGMGKELLENSSVFKTAFDGFNQEKELEQVCFSDEIRLSQTRDAQWAIYSISLATVALLKDVGIVPNGCIGLSLGEYSAYATAGAMTYTEGNHLTRQRGKMMQETIEKTISGMAAILSLDAASIEEACLEASQFGNVSVANYNAPDQIVITGEQEALEKAMQICRDKGARRAIKLQVSGGFHSQLLNSAKPQLRQELEQVNWSKCNVPVYTNLTGKPTDDIITSLVEQLVSPVRFQEGIEAMIEDGYDTFIEIGPKATCSSFIKKICTNKNKSVQILNVEDMKSFTKTKEIVLGGTI